MTPTNYPLSATDPLTAMHALAQSGFNRYRKTSLTSISDITFPPGTVYQTPEGLRADDEETRCAFDVQGGIYPIRESVFQASYEVAAQPVPALDVERLLRVEAAARGEFIATHHPECPFLRWSPESMTFRMCLCGLSALRAALAEPQP